jgi:hypothetical protein
MSSESTVILTLDDLVAVIEKITTYDEVARIIVATHDGVRKDVLDHLRKRFEKIAKVDDRDPFKLPHDDVRLIILRVAKREERFIFVTESQDGWLKQPFAHVWSSFFVVNYNGQ